MEIDDIFRISASIADSVKTDWKRSIYDKLDWNLPMISIKGARGIGKTTMLLQRLKENYKGEEGLYVSLDNIWFTNHRLLDLVSYHYAHGGKCLFADEVHRYPYLNWVQEMKNIYDSYPGYKVAFTGSSLLKIDMSIADLSRRCSFYNMQGLSFREWLGLQGLGEYSAYSLEDILKRHVEITRELAPKIKPLKYFKEYLRTGYYPFYTTYASTYRETLQQIANAIIENDLTASMNVERQTVIKFKHLLYIISSMVPFKPNIASLCRNLQTTRETMYGMLETLSKAALIINLYSGKDNMRQMEKPEKIYLENTNLLHAFSSNVDVGNERETFFANQLKEGHHLTFSGDGDFLIDGKYTVEVGGKDKTFDQIKDVPDSYLAIDDVEIGHANRIPLWLFGFLY